VLLNDYFCLVALNQGCGSGSTLKNESGSRSIQLFEESEAKAFFIKHVAGIRKWKHFESWKQTRKRLTLYGLGSGSKKYSSASTSLLWTNNKLTEMKSNNQTKKL